MRCDWTTFYDIRRRIKLLQLTGNFGETEFHITALVEFSLGEQSLGHLYDIANHKESYFRNKIEYK